MSVGLTARLESSDIVDLLDLQSPFLSRPTTFPGLGRDIPFFRFSALKEFV